MRAVPGLIAIAALAAGAAALPARPAEAVCSVFDNRPCTPTVCSVFDTEPCLPEVQYPRGQTLQVTVESAPSRVAQARAEPSSDRKVDTLQELFAALRECWVPPLREEARPGMQMSVVFSLKRDGEIIGTPRVSYATPDISRETRERYHATILAALGRCTPLPLSAGLGGAIAGRPIAMRFIDNRK